MSLTTGQTILKDSGAYSKPGIVQALMSADFPGTEYAEGTRFNDSQSVLYYSSENIESLYSGAVEVPKYFDASLFCQTSSYLDVINIYEILDDVTNEKKINFNDLSTMIVNAFLPLTNIRLSLFRTLNQNPDGTYWLDERWANVYLTDKSITSNNSIPFFMRNKAQSKQLISTRDDFLFRDDIIDMAAALRIVFNQKHNSAKEVAYKADSSKHIKIDVLNDIFSACVSYLNAIRTTLTCLFENVDISDYERTITYHSQVSTDVDQTFSKTYYLNTNVAILKWGEAFPKKPEPNPFLGWTTVKDSGKVSYKASDDEVDHVVILENFDLYPVSLKPATIKYHADTASNIVKAGTEAEVHSFETYVYEVKGIEPPGGQRLSYLTPEIQNTYSGQFSGYSYSQDSAIAVRAGNKITLEPKTYHLYPKFKPYEQSFLFKKGFHWIQGGSSTRSYTNGIELDLGVDLSLFNRVDVEFTGWVNEFDHTHTCNVYCIKVFAKYPDGRENIVSNTSTYIFGYSAGNGWSMHRSEDAGAYGTWPKTVLTFTKPAGGWSGNFLGFQVKIIDWFNENSGSEGDVYIGKIKLY